MHVFVVASCPLPGLSSPQKLHGFTTHLLLHPSFPVSLQTQSCQLFELSLSLLTNYASSASSKYQEGHVAEEEQCEDLVVCFRMLKNLTTKDFIDFADTSGEMKWDTQRHTHQKMRSKVKIAYMW